MLGLNIERMAQKEEGLEQAFRKQGLLLSYDRNFEYSRHIKLLTLHSGKAFT